MKPLVNRLMTPPNLRINAGASFVPAENHVVVDRDLVTGRSFADVEAYWQAIVETAEAIN